MNLIRKIIAFLVVAAISLSFCGCHQKNEIAFKLNGDEYKTSYYLATVYECGVAAIKKIVNDDTDSKIDTTKEGFYLNKKIDKKTFETYVKDNVTDTLKKIAAYKAMMKKYGIKLSDSDEEQIKSTYDQGSEWALYGEFFEANGVSEETYKQYFHDTCLYYFAFNGIYGKDGKKAISDEEIKAYFDKNYVLVNALETSNYASLDDDKKEEEKTKFEGYVKALSSGKMTFNEVYSNYTNPTEAIADASTDYDQVLDSTDSNFETIKEMANGSVKLITLDNDAGFRIVVKKDLYSNEKALDSKDSEIRDALKGDEFEEEVNKLIKNFKIEDYGAIKSIKIKKIKFDDLYAAYAAYEDYYSKQLTQQAASQYQQ